MRPLPVTRYEYGEWIKGKVNIDYHVEAVRSYYSVPYGLIHKILDVRLTAATVEIWHEGRRVASHLRIYQEGRHQTQDAHGPPAHKKYLEWTPERILAWGRKTGPATEALMDKVMASRKHPEQGFRSCLGILRLVQRYDPQRLERACQRALAIGGHSYKSVRSILENGLEAHPVAEKSTGAFHLEPLEPEASNSNFNFILRALCSAVHLYIVFSVGLSFHGGETCKAHSEPTLRKSTKIFFTSKNQ